MARRGGRDHCAGDPKAPFSKGTGGVVDRRSGCRHVIQDQHREPSAVTTGTQASCHIAQAGSATELPLIGSPSCGREDTQHRQRDSCGEQLGHAISASTKRRAGCRDRHDRTRADAASRGIVNGFRTGGTQGWRQRTHLGGLPVLLHHAQDVRHRPRVRPSGEKGNAARRRASHDVRLQFGSARRAQCRLRLTAPRALRAQQKGENLAAQVKKLLKRQHPSIVKRTALLPATRDQISGRPVSGTVCAENDRIRSR